ncbi:MAG: cytochrome c3 family protein [Methanocella sp.]
MKWPVRAAVLLVLVVGVLLVPAALAGTIKGSLHDLSEAMKNVEMAFWDNYNDYNQVCVYCHTPHNSLPGEQLLWNRQMPTGPYTLYRSESLISPVNAPGNHSLMCLSCHDGTIAVDAVVRMPLTSPDGRPLVWSNPTYPGYESMHGKMANGSQSSASFVDCGVACHSASPIAEGFDYSGTYMTQNMSDDHPVTIDYPDPLTYGARFMPVPAGERWTNGVQLYSNKVECGSCHDVHNPDWKPFLRCSNDASALCFTCHNK